MKIGVVREIKNNENRVALTPAGADRLSAAGHEVLVELGAGRGSGLEDEAYVKAGARIVPDADTVFGECELVLKVKEPLKEEWPRMRRGQTLFTYFHLAADRALTEGMIASGAHCLAYETLEVKGGLPLLTPMSEVAGRLSIQAGAFALQKANGGRGVLLGGVPGVSPAKVVIIGGGHAGTNAAQMAMGMGADVTVLDRSVPRLRYLSELFDGRVKTVYSTRQVIDLLIPEADLVVGAVLVPGAAAPKLVTAEHVRAMRPGAVLVDISIDQGGCFETSRPTTHAEPTYIVDDVVHYCVTNMPGAVPRTSTFALTNVTLPFVKALANLGWREALSRDRHLANGLNVHAGRVNHEAVARDLGYEYLSAEQALKAA